MGAMYERVIFMKRLIGLRCKNTNTLMQYKKICRTDFALFIESVTGLFKW
jgi:hypothetical protein